MSLPVAIKHGVPESAAAPESNASTRSIAGFWQPIGHFLGSPSIHLQPPRPDVRDRGKNGLNSHCESHDIPIHVRSMPNGRHFPWSLTVPPAAAVRRFGGGIPIPHHVDRICSICSMLNMAITGPSYFHTTYPQTGHDPKTLSTCSRRLSHFFTAQSWTRLVWQSSDSIGSIPSSKKGARSLICCLRWSSVEGGIPRRPLPSALHQCIGGVGCTRGSKTQPHA
ncbi:unnamed protein product [Periconia digitata]|uniref:Uncharacterized protein n=1 Tax=Periconia digitata TaxID=1303443 RepID=A0A9W4U1M0_9PLEO|nr:unnamed protein product [Periconia digitata]